VFFVFCMREAWVEVEMEAEVAVAAPARPSGGKLVLISQCQS